MNYLCLIESKLYTLFGILPIYNTEAFKKSQNKKGLKKPLTLKCLILNC